MDDDESRPHKALRRVPGSFDDAEISPTKEDFRDTGPSLAEAHFTALKSEDIPPLRPADASFADGPSLLAVDKSDSFTEQAVREHLRDIESSFAVPLSPIPTISRDGVDDTCLFDSPRKPE